MRKILSGEITDTVAKMCIEANCNLDSSILENLENAKCKKQSSSAFSALNSIIKNAQIAKDRQIPICQDTGMAVFFVKVGKDVFIEGDNLDLAIEKGVRLGYTEGFLRKSIVSDPLFRQNTEDNTPPVIHYSFNDSDKVEITFLPKGFGSENKSALKMLNPSDGRDGIIEFVTDTVKKAGASPCPPIIIGVGIGGNFEKCAQLSKLALARNINIPNANPYYAKLEEEILSRVNGLGIGPQGYGGETTALGVNIEVYPTHIAGLPVAVNISCHATRHQTAVI
jgi:fumarate hydratase subunit alpha